MEKITKHSALKKAKMQQPSVFVADCLCGRRFETVDRDYECPVCHQHILLDWRSEEPALRPIAAEVAAPETAA